MGQHRRPGRQRDVYDCALPRKRCALRHYVWHVHVYPARVRRAGPWAEPEPGDAQGLRPAWESRSFGVEALTRVEACLGATRRLRASVSKPRRASRPPFCLAGGPARLSLFDRRRHRRAEPLLRGRARCRPHGRGGLHVLRGWHIPDAGAVREDQRRCLTRVDACISSSTLSRETRLLDARQGNR